MIDIDKLRRYLGEYGAVDEISTTIRTFIDYVEGKQRTRGGAVIPLEKREQVKRFKHLEESQKRHKEDNLNPDEDFNRIQTL